MARGFRFCLIALLLMAPRSLSGQRVAPRLLVTAEPSEPSCQIDLEQVALLGDDSEGYILGWPAAVFKDQVGRWFVLERGSPSEAKVFDFGGSFLRKFGRHGEGPGEFRPQAAVIEYPLDTLNVFDPVAPRISRFSSDLVFVDQISLDIVPYYILFTETGKLVANAPRLAPSGLPLPLHFIGADGSISFSFGAVDPPFSTNRGPSHHLRRITAARSGGIWEASLNNYRINLWDDSGRLQKVLQRDAEWFPSHRDPSIREDPRGPEPNPKFRALEEDAEGRHWTAVYVPQKDWREGFVPDTNRAGRIYLRPVEEEQFDTRLEVLDPYRGSVISSRLIPEALGGFAGRGDEGVFFYAGHYSGIGEPFIKVWQALLSCETQREGGTQSETLPKAHVRPPTFF